VARARAPSRAWLARFAAPAAFLAGVTIAVLLVRAGLASSDETRTADTPTTTVTTPAPAPPPPPATRGGGTTTAPEEREFYTIESGDTFAALAARFGTTVAELIRLNPQVDPAGLSVGQRIRVR
jgi:LysM domain